MKTAVKTVNEYLAALPEERRAAVAAVRKVILDNLPPGLVETFGFGMIAYVVPLSRFPKTYNGQPLMFAGLAAQKNYFAIHIMSLYGSADKSFAEAYKKTGKKLDMGKCCVRFKSLDDLPLELIGKTIADCSTENLMAAHEASHSKEAVAARRAKRAKK